MAGAGHGGDIRALPWHGLGIDAAAANGVCLGTSGIGNLADSGGHSIV